MPRRGRRGTIEQRMCALEGCERRAKRGSVHCEDHARTAIGRRAKRELKELLRQLEVLAAISDPEERRRAEGRFQARVESGAFATLFSQQLKEAQEEMREHAELRIELGAGRIALMRAMLEVDDPVEMANVIARLSEVNRKLVATRRHS